MNTENRSTATDLGLLTLRLTAGGLMAGHGAQKLFGSFGGHGIAGTAGRLESLGLKPGEQWATVAGASEFGSGLLTALGLCSPIGPIAMFGPMIMAWITAHAGKPIWVTSGGAELPLMYMTSATALAFTGPGRYSLDKALGIKVPTVLAALTVAGVAAGIAVATVTREQRAEKHEQEDQTSPATSEHTETPEQFRAREVGGDVRAGSEAEHDDAL